MGLDESGQDFERGLHEIPVDPHLVSVLAGAQMNHAGLVSRLVLHDAVVVEDLPPQHGLQLLGRVGTVGADGVDQGDVVSGNLLQFR